VGEVVDRGAAPTDRPTGALFPRGGQAPPLAARSPFSHAGEDHETQVSREPGSVEKDDIGETTGCIAAVGAEWDAKEVKRNAVSWPSSVT